MANNEENNKKTQNKSYIADSIGPVLFVIIAIAVMVVCAHFMK
jgi:hypothetical protein